MKKILLLTDIPPCKSLTAGLVLDQLCRFLPKGSIACFAIVNPAVKARITADLDWIPVEYYVKPCESRRVFSDTFSAVNKTCSYLMEYYSELVLSRRITGRVREFAERFKPDMLWCVIQGQTEVHLASKVADLLGIPLLIQIWDPLYFWMDSHIPDEVTRNRILRKFEKILRSCDGFFAASTIMAEQYHRDYGVRTVPFLPSLDERLALPPAEEINPGSEFIIGGAGKLYPAEVWHALFKALDSVDWQIEKRNVRIRLLAQDAVLHAEGKMNFEFLGWRSQNEAIQLLSEADLLYCPYWFDPYYEEITKLSFPGKLTTFLATGRPVMFHGPQDASPARFLRAHDTGVLCHSLEPHEIVAVLSAVIKDRERYAILARNGRHAFDRHLTLKSMRRNFAEFLMIDESLLLDGYEVSK